MATYDYIATSTNMYDGSDVRGIVGLDEGFFAQRTINLETAADDLKDTTDFAQNDVIELIQIPANTWVHTVVVKVTTASDVAADVDFGDGGNTDGYIDGLAMTSTGTSSSLASSVYSLALAGGRVYTSADTIDMLFNTSGAIDDGIFTITVKGYRLA